MAKKEIKIEEWVAKRLLGLFNRASIAADISYHSLRDDPTTGQGRFIIGEKVAQRIIDKRNKLPGMMFREIAQLSGIDGLGDGKLNDLLDVLSTPSAEAFRVSMYHHVLRESHWMLEHCSTKFEDEEQFLNIAADTRLLTEFVIGQARIIARDRYRDNRLHAKIASAIQKAPLELYDSGHVAAHAFALWLFKLTADSWFSYEQVQRETAAYLDFMPDWLDRTDLFMFHGFKNEGQLTGPISPLGLPVTVNHAEHTISLWTAQVID